MEKPRFFRGSGRRRSRSTAHVYLSYV